MITADEIRQKFLDFFARRGHTIVPSDSLVPKDDPTVLFTTAGMQQFKRQFLGQTDGFKRAATCQKCLRTDDLDQVGKTPFHHTFFEMLGNFSFGDYFKKDAINWAWEFLTKELKIPEEKLWVSVYKEDSEAEKIWLENVKISKERLVKLGDKSNFWPSEAKEKGPNGPCGPCSEIFYDYGVNPDCKSSKCDPSCDCGRFSEVWNLVFTQFNRKDPSTGSGQSGGILEPLPNKNIDTGMGLERLVAVVQGKRSNYETDLFEPMIKNITELVDGISETDTRIIADHMRAIVFAIGDGVVPSNKGRGFVVKKLITTVSDIFLRHTDNQTYVHNFVSHVVAIMKDVYPNLKNREDEIGGYVRKTEEDYKSVFTTQIPKLKTRIWDIGRTNQSREQKINELGKLFFFFRDTYGLSIFTIKETAISSGVPMEALEEAIEKGLDILNRSMKEQQSRSRAGSKMTGDVFADAELNLNVLKTKFLGYENFQCSGKILKLFKENKRDVQVSVILNEAKRSEESNGILRLERQPQDDDKGKKLAHGLNKEVEIVQEGDSIKIILDQTPFYAESGGQVGDTGIIKILSFPTKAFGGDNSVEGSSSIRVSNTQKIADVFIHTGTVTQGSFKINNAVQTQIDENRRRAIMRNHTATHLLQAALRKILGAHVQQQGSLVAEDRLRFDFTHHQPITKEQILAIESWVNSTIMGCDAVDKKEMPISEAKASGALAFFAEKYGETVRVVSMGGYSKEFCGGTHLNLTGQIGSFKIVSEGSVAQGIRRIEAVTGDAVFKYFNTQKEKVDEELKAQVLRVKQLEKELETSRFETIKNSLETILKNAETIGKTKIITATFKNIDAPILRKVSDLIKQKVTSAVVALGSNYLENAFILVVVTDDLVQKGIKANELIKSIAPLIDGAGGGRPDLAQAGSKAVEKIDGAIAQARQIISKVIKGSSSF